MRDQDLNERPGEAPPQSKLESPRETKTKQKRSPSTHRVEPWKVLSIRVRSSMRDQDLNERPGEAPPQSKLKNPRETNTKQKRGPSTHNIETWKVILIKFRRSMKDQDFNERPRGAPPQSKLENPGETKTKEKRSPSTRRVEPRRALLIRVRGSMRDQDFNKRPGEAPPQSKLEIPRETKTKQKRSPITLQGRTAEGTLNHGQEFNGTPGLQ